MSDFQGADNKDWRKILRSEIITGIVGNQQEKNNAFAQIGYYYMCCAPASIYKYYSDRIEKIETVKAGKMWYSAPCNFNDVFDCDFMIDEEKIFNSALEMIPDKRGVRPESPMWRQLNQTIDQEIRVLKTNLDHMKTVIGISCFSESYDSLLMWAHYANNHRGMCVEYDLLEINRRLRFSPVPVIYSSERPLFHAFNQDTIKADTLSVFIESLTSKSPEWSYEKEWRIIRDDGACGINWDAERKGALLDMIRPTSVILGCMAKPEFESVVHKYCEEFRINLFKMEKDSYLYRLRKVPVLQFDN